jgi:hypothetical protein
MIRIKFNSIFSSTGSVCSSQVYQEKSTSVYKYSLKATLLVHAIFILGFKIIIQRILII